MAYQCKGLNQSNIVCEYEVNLSTNEKVITKKKHFVKEQCWISRSSEGQGQNVAWLWKGLDLSNNVFEYEVNRLTNEKVIRGKQNFNANC